MFSKENSTQTSVREKYIQKEFSSILEIMKCDSRNIDPVDELISTIIAYSKLPLPENNWFFLFSNSTIIIDTVIFTFQQINFYLLPNIQSDDLSSELYIYMKGELIAILKKMYNIPLHHVLTLFSNREKIYSVLADKYLIAEGDEENIDKYFHSLVFEFKNILMKDKIFNEFREYSLKDALPIIDAELDIACENEILKFTIHIIKKFRPLIENILNSIQ